MRWKYIGPSTVESRYSKVDILGTLVHVYLILPHCQVVSCWACTTERRGGEVRFGSVGYTMLYYAVLYHYNMNNNNNDDDDG